MHNKYYRSYNENVDKKAIQESWEDYANRDGDGLYGDIKWKDLVFEDYDKAMQYIETYCDSYSSWGVKYKAPIEELNSKTLSDLRQKAANAYDIYKALERKIHYAGVKSSYISCGCCGSKINSSYFGKTINNTCLICRNDLRPASTLEAIEKAKQKHQSLCEKVREEETKLAEKAKKKTCWLVKIEYHS